MVRNVVPLPPRVSAPDLPSMLAEGPPPSRDAESFQLRLGGWEQTTDAAHAEITECVVAPASIDRLDLTGASLVDVDIDQLRATTVTVRGGRLRRVRIVGGRIGTLDLSDADVDEVELNGVRIDYLGLGRARVQDLVVTGCTIGSLDMPQATVSRVAFTDSRADEVDTRSMRAKNLDLRGLEAASYLDLAALRGATLSPRQVEYMAVALAGALGIQVLD